MFINNFIIYQENELSNLSLNYVISFIDIEQHHSIYN